MRKITRKKQNLDDIPTAKKKKVGKRSLAKSYLINKMKCNTTKSDLDKLRRIYSILNDVILKVLGPKNTLNRPLGNILPYNCSLILFKY